MNTFAQPERHRPFHRPRRRAGAADRRAQRGPDQPQPGGHRASGRHRLHEHHHTVADEVYLVRSGRGRVRVDGETRAVGPGDAVIIRPGQRHKVWSDGPEDLVLIVSCAPAYEVGEVVWDE